MSLYIDIEKELSSFKLEVKIEQKNEIVAFLGQSGSGKSMTLKCIAGLETPTKGKIILNDKVLFDSENNINIPTKDRNVGFLFQNYALFPHMKVIENIEIGLEGLSKEERSKISNYYIEKFQLKELEKRYPWQLSGGQQQRVALARALAKSPDILLLDEPFSALDLQLRYTMERELMDLLKDYKGNIIFVTHDISEAYRVSNDIVIYDSGKSISKRSKEELFKSPKSIQEAKLTGMRNISRVDITNNNEVHAIDWGCSFSKLSKSITNCNYIAIRETNIELIDNMDTKEDNQFKIVNVIENPFNNIIEIKSIKSNECNSLWIEVTKKERVYNIGEVVTIKVEHEDIIAF